jgi:hypothetical protein
VPLGQVTGEGGDMTLESATNDARNKSAAMGGNFLRLDPPQFAVSGNKRIGVSSIPVRTGTAYSCPNGGMGGSRTGRGGGSSARASTSAPTGAAGFPFGASVDQAKTACEGAKKTWTQEGSDTFTCSGAVTPTGTGGTVTLESCGTRLCRVTVVVKPDAGEWWDTHKALRTKLEEKYGKPAKNHTTGNADCQERLSDCLRDGLAVATSTWTFPGEVSIRLVSGINGEDPAAIRVIYAGKGKPAVDTEGL